MFLSVTELTEGKADSADVASAFPASEMSTLLGAADPNGSLEDFLNSCGDMTAWDFDLPPADLPPTVLPKLEAGVSNKSVERPLSGYGNTVQKQQPPPPPPPIDKHYQAANNWPQPPHSIRPTGSYGAGRMHQMMAAPPPCHVNSIQDHSAVEMHSHMPPLQPGARQASVPFRNVQPRQQRDMLGPPHQFLQHQSPMMAGQTQHMRSMSPAVQPAVPANPPAAMMHAAESAMSNQLHNLQVMVNNHTHMMQHHNRSNVSPSNDALIHAKMHRSQMRMHAGGRHANDVRMFQSPEYLPPQNMMHPSQAHLMKPGGGLHEPSAGMVAHPAATGFHSPSVTTPQHGMIRGQMGPVVPQNPSIARHPAMMANQPPSMHPQPELRQFSARSHGMSPMHCGALQPSGPGLSQMGISGQQMGIPNQQLGISGQQMMPKQPPVPKQHLGRGATVHKSSAVLDKNSAALQWHAQCSTPSIVAQPTSVPNMAATQAHSSPAMHQFTPTLSPAAACNVSHGHNSSAQFSAEIDCLSFLSDSFLSQVADDGYNVEPRILPPMSNPGIEHIGCICI